MDLDFDELLDVPVPLNKKHKKKEKKDRISPKPELEV